MANKLKLLLSFCVLSLLLSLIVVPGSRVEAQGFDKYTPYTVQHSIYQLVALKDGDRQWTGTGWMFIKNRMLTAGHVCDSEGEDGITFRAISKWNQEYPVRVIKFSRDPDICLLEATNVPLGMGLRRFASMPSYGSDLWYSGAPNGVFGDGTVPFAKGFYIGGYRMMIAGYPGASGSPVYDETGIVGILVRGYRGTHIMEFESSEEILQFLRE